MKMFVLLLSLCDGYIIGTIAAVVAKKLWGDTPKGRFIEVVGGLGSGIIYTLFCLVYWLTPGNDQSMLLALLILFGPVGMVLVFALLGYMYKK